VKSVTARGDGPLDAAWMTRTFDAFWEGEGRPAYELTSLFLQPMTPAGRLLLLAQHGSDGVRTDGPQTIANFFANSLAEPASVLPMLTDTARAKRVIAEATGRPWVAAVARGALGIAGDQVRRGLGALRARG
jgi:hypothetical protein